MTQYEQLAIVLLDHLNGDILPLPDWFMLERNEQRIAVAVHETLGISPEHWAKLNEVEREPWLQKTLDKLAPPEVSITLAEAARMLGLPNVGENRVNSAGVARLIEKGELRDNGGHGKACRRVALSSVEAYLAKRKQG